jgi:hypothetical protein
MYARPMVACSGYHGLSRLPNNTESVVSARHRSNLSEHDNTRIHRITGPICTLELSPYVHWKAEIPIYIVSLREKLHKSRPKRCDQ